MVPRQPGAPNGERNAPQTRQQAAQREEIPRAIAKNESSKHERTDARRYPPLSCYNPIRAYRTETGEIVFDEKKRHGNYTGQLDLPCGRCIQCRMQRAADWAARVMHESQMWDENCFVTLTYGTGNLPANGSLEHRDFQLFAKKLTKRNGPTRYYMCGEYGPQGGRPHYHACIFNKNFYDRKAVGKSGSGEPMYESRELTELWGHGMATVQDLTPGTAAYCARYIMKKTLGEGADTAYDIEGPNGEILKRKPEYSAMSLKPGIGATWLAKHGNTDAFNQDFVVIDGAKRALPKYYTKILKRQNGGQLPERIDIQRQELAIKSRPNTTPERLKVRQEVHEAKIRNLKRTLE